MMDLRAFKQRASLSWVSLALLVALVSVLGVLQYQWIGQISEAERKQRRDGLRGRLIEITRDFNSAVNSACAALMPAESEIVDIGLLPAYEARYRSWSMTAAHRELLRRVGLAWLENGKPVLRLLDRASGHFVPAEWPEEWNRMKERVSGHGVPPPAPTSMLLPVTRFGHMDRGGQSQQQYSFLADRDRA